MQIKTKRIIYILVIILILPLIISYGIVDPIMHGKTDKKIKKWTQNLYSISYSGYHFNLYTFTIHAKDIKVIPDGTQLDRVKVTKLVKFYADEIDIGFYSFFKWYFSNKLNINSLYIENPVIRIVNLPFSHSNLKIEQEFEGLQGDIRCGKLNLKNGAFINYDFVQNRIKYSIKNFSVNLSDFQIHKDFNLDSIKYRNLNGTINSFIAVADSFHTLKIQKIKLSQKFKIAQIEKLNYSPRYGKYQLSKYFDKNVYWQHLSVPEMSFVNLNFDSIINKKLQAQKIYVSKALYESFSDKRYKRDTTRSSYFLNKLKESVFKFKIDTIDIYKSNIHVETLSKNNRLPSKIYLSEVTGDIRDVWLSDNPKDENSYIKIALNGYFLKLYPFTLHSFPAHYPNNWKHYGDAHIEKFDFKDISKYIKDNYRIKIKSGSSQGLDFKFYVNKDSLQGDFTFKYQQLKFDYIKNGNTSQMMRFLQSLGVFASSNPIKNRKLRTVPVKYKIKAEDNLLQIWLKGIEQGVVKSVIPVSKWKN